MSRTTPLFSSPSLSVCREIIDVWPEIHAKYKIAVFEQSVEFFNVILMARNHLPLKGKLNTGTDVPLPESLEHLEHVVVF